MNRVYRNGSVRIQLVNFPYSDIIKLSNRSVGQFPAYQFLDSGGRDCKNI